MSLQELLGIPTGEKRVVSICGGGGKTSLMFALARECGAKEKTALFTTTHIFRPDVDGVFWPQPFTSEACVDVWDDGRIVAAGRWLEEERRFGPPPEEEQRWLTGQADAVFIEADGSKRLPLKYPAAWEPVIRPETTHTVVVAGLSALGQPPERALHRHALAREKLGYDEALIGEEGMARVLWAGYGRYEPVFLLNQADTPEREACGRRIAEKLLGHGARRVVVISLRELGYEWKPAGRD